MNSWLTGSLIILFSRILPTPNFFRHLLTDWYTLTYEYWLIQEEKVIKRRIPELKCENYESYNYSDIKKYIQLKILNIIKALCDLVQLVSSRWFIFYFSYLWRWKIVGNPNSLIRGLYNNSTNDVLLLVTDVSTCLADLSWLRP